MPQLLGQLLQQQGQLQADQLERALLEQEAGQHQKLLGEILVDARACSTEQVSEALARSHGVPFARISPRLVDPAVVALLPQQFLTTHQVLPLFVVEGVLTVALAEPASLFLLEEIRRLTGHAVQVVATMASDIHATLQAYLPGERVFVVDEIIDQLFGPAENGGSRENAGSAIQFTSTSQLRPIDPSELARSAGDAPVVRLVNYLIHAAVKESATQVHVEPAPANSRVRFRIDGHLHDRLKPPAAMHAPLVARLKTLAGLDVAQRSLPQQGSIALRANGRSILLRLTIMPGATGERVVLQVVDADRPLLRLERLGFSYDTLKAWRKLLGRTGGLLLVTGPVGSGKTTTLHASLAELNREDANICALEEQLEQQMPGVNHFVAGEMAGLQKSQALSAILQQQPDVLMVGDIGDAETAHLCSSAALSGRMILAGMSAPDAATAIARLNQLAGQPFALGETLAGVLCQRLVRKLCPACREAAAPSAAERRTIEKCLTPAGGSAQGGTAAGSGAVETLYHAKGCPQCHNTGFVGRIGVFELLPIDSLLAERVGRSATMEELRPLASRCVGKSLVLDGIEKVRSGMTTLDEVLRATA